MPRLIEYPRASFSRAMDMAAAIDYLGGSCSPQSCADRMGLKVTGAFTALIGSAKKHELIDSNKDGLFITDTYKNIKLAYNDDEKRQNLRLAFLSPPLYRKIYDKFKGKELPLDMLSKLLIREYSVEENISTRIVGYFLEGARSCEILIDNKLIDIDGVINNQEREKVELKKPIDTEPLINDIEVSDFETSNQEIKNEIYVVHILGPGINSKLTIAESEDFLILEAMISKLKKKIKLD